VDVAKMVEQVQQLQSNLRKMSVEACAGGAVTVQMNGRQELVQVRVSDGAYRMDNERLAGCITEAFNLALDKSRQLVREEVMKYTGGLDLSNIPNLSNLF
jgi:DNA-binding protein YbaB